MSRQFNHTFVSESERDFYTGVAASYMSEGRIVDAGCFAGGTTTALCRGLGSTYHFPPVVALDRFQVSDAYIVGHFAQCGVDIRFGESFLPIFLDNIEPYRQLVEVRAGDIFSIARIEGSIEILLIDIAKSPAINSFLIQQWFGSLIPGRSTLIHQDFHAPSQPWLAASIGEILNFLTVIKPKIGESACFRLDKPLPKQMIESAARCEWRSPQGIDALDRVADALGDENSSSIRIMQAQAHRHLGNIGLARKIVENLVDRDPQPHDQKWKQWLGMAIASIHPSMLSSKQLLAQIYDEDGRFRLGDW